MRPSWGSSRLLPIAILIILAAVVVLSPLATRGTTGEEATFCLGFVLLFAFFLAKILKDIHLPEISGYIIAGIFCGPFALNILSIDVVRRLQIFDDVALAIIALIAGGELRMAFLRKNTRPLFSVVGGQILFSFIGAFLVVALARPAIPFLSGMTTGAFVSVALLFGLVTAARSPATTIGVIMEMRAKGPLTDLLVGITVVLDVIVLVLVAFVVPLAQALNIPGESFSFHIARDLMIRLSGSIGIGLFFGALVASYIRWVGGYLPLFLIGVGFVGSLVCEHFDLEPILAFLIAGFVIENFTELGDALIKGLGKSALPVYVVFFSISGASLDFDALRAMWPIALLLMLVRGGAFFLGGLAAGVFVKAVKPHVNNLWLGLLSQAGVTIGIVTVIESRFEWGGEMKTIVLAVVALNQLVGPMALKHVLEKTGEATKSLTRSTIRSGR